MMLTFLTISVIIAMLQTAGAYLRYLPFRSGMSPQESDRLWQFCLTWAILSVGLNTFLLATFNLNVPLYKAIMFFGWLPYFLISVKVVNRPLAAHVFVLGMQCLWALTLHTAAATLELFAGFPEDLERLSFTHAASYLLLFILLLPAERAVFQNLLPSPELFLRSFRWPMSLFPIIIFIGASLPIADSQLIHDWQYRFARFGLPFTFFFVYRAMSIASTETERNNRNMQESTYMRRQIAVLKEYSMLYERSSRQVMAIYQAMSESYERLDRYLAISDTKGALKHIETQEKRLDKTPLRRYAEFPLINAALSIYIHRAEKLGIHPKVKINLPKNMSTDEHDLAVLISNLLENAVEAEARQPPGRRFLSVIIEADSGQCVLEIVNLSDEQITFGENKLPHTDAPGHGIGMTSLEAFAEKYDAYVDFTQEKERVQVSMYWEDSDETCS